MTRAQTTELEAFDRRLRDDPDGPYLDFEGVQLTAREMDATANRIAHALHDMGVVHGDRIATLLMGPGRWGTCHRHDLQAGIGARRSDGRAIPSLVQPASAAQVPRHPPRGIVQHAGDLGRAQVAEALPAERIPVLRVRSVEEDHVQSGPG